MKKSLLIIFFASVSFAQSTNFNPPYPRIGIQQWGGGVLEFYARYDFVDIGIIGGDAIASQIRQANSGIILVPTSDWNAAAHVDSLNDEWVLRNSSGQLLTLYFENDKFYDLTNFCPQVNGRRYNEYLPKFLTSGRVNFNVYDGVATDGLWNGSSNVDNGDVDLDRNGINDYDEHGAEWIEAQFEEGIDSVLVRLIRMMPENKIILINSGGLHDWLWNHTNVIMVEDLSGIFGVEYLKSQYDGFIAQGRSPAYTMFMTQPSTDYAWTPEISKNDYSLMRFALTFCLLGPGFMAFEDVESFEHYGGKWYDEFDVNLGYPTGSASEVQPGVWARTFDLGMSIFNGSGDTVTVTTNDLEFMPGYSPPYYRINGGQDHATNDGSLFDEVTLWGKLSYPDPGNQLLTITHGDGLVLIKTQKTVVANIIIDNVESGTSPGSVAATYGGTWTQACDGASSFYTVRCAEWLDFYGYARADGAAGTCTATFTPTIGVAGDYEIYEWHGKLNSGAATSVPHLINYNGGQITININQSVNHGKWNSLGIYSLSAGTGNYVRITNNSSGTAMADAIKFRNLTTDPGDSTPPATPTGFTVY